MGNLAGFNAATVDPTDNFAPLPPGDYPVVITESDMKPTKSGSGEYLQLTLEVIDGPMKGRKLWDRLNLVNSNTTAVEIAQRALSQICHAVNVMTPQDSHELHGKPLVATVATKDEPGYGVRNEVKKYGAMNGAQPAAMAAQPAAVPAAAPTAAGPQVSASPWAR